MNSIYFEPLLSVQVQYYVGNSTARRVSEKQNRLNNGAEITHKYTCVTSNTTGTTPSSRTVQPKV